MGLKQIINNYFSIIKLKNSIYILEIIVSFFILIELKIIMVSNIYYIFNFLIFTLLFQIAYFDVYIINDILDYKKDLKQKRQDKPLVTKKITIKQAKILLLGILCFITLNLVITKNLVGLTIIYFIIIYNVFYTKFLKKSLTTTILGNGFTHFYRVLIALIYSYFYSGISSNKEQLFAIILFLLYYWVTSSLFTFYKQALYKMNFKNNKEFIKVKKLLAFLNLIILLLGIYASFILFNNKLILGLFIILNLINILSIYIYENKPQILKKYLFNRFLK